jgi:SAM-dependent methyltransferase
MFWSLYATCYDALSRLKAYKEMQVRTLQLLSPTSGEQILDAGSGTGNLIRAIEDMAEVVVVGVDCNPGMLAVAKRKQLRATLWRCDLNEVLPFRDSTFDKAVSTNNLYVLADPVSVLREFRRVLRKGGKLIIVNPVPGFSPGKILRDHLDRTKDLWGWLEVVIHIPHIMAILLLNLFIVNKGRAGSYHFADVAKWQQWVRDSGLSVDRLELVYADQALLVSLVKEEVVPGA